MLKISTNGPSSKMVFLHTEYITHDYRLRSVLPTPAAETPSELVSCWQL